MSRKPLEFLSNDFTLTRLSKELVSLKEDSNLKLEELHKNFDQGKKELWEKIRSRLVEMGKLSSSIPLDKVDLEICDGVIFDITEESESPSSFTKFMRHILKED